MKDIYTGREIAIFTDSHALLEPTVAVLDDINRRGITEIYSLGDNIGVGPNPSEVLNLLKERGVKSVSGNSEYYCSLGIEPFASYFNELKYKSHLWTLSKLNEQQLGEVKLYPASIQLLVGGQKLALCHFANDVRFDFFNRSTWTYQRSINSSGKGYEQFDYTNSFEQKKQIALAVNISEDDPDYERLGGYISASEDPLFNGKKVEFFDAIIQGHIHFKIYEESDTTKFWSIRAAGIGYGKDPIDTASYVILKEKNNNMGFDLIEVLVKYDREKMIYSILESDNPDSYVRTFTNMVR